MNGKTSAASAFTVGSSRLSMASPSVIIVRRSYYRKNYHNDVDRASVSVEAFPGARSRTSKHGIRRSLTPASLSASPVTQRIRLPLAPRDLPPTRDDIGDG